MYVHKSGRRFGISLALGSGRTDFVKVREAMDAVEHAVTDAGLRLDEGITQMYVRGSSGSHHLEFVWEEQV